MKRGFAGFNAVLTVVLLTVTLGLTACGGEGIEEKADEHGNGDGKVMLLRIGEEGKPLSCWLTEWSVKLDMESEDRYEVLIAALSKKSVKEQLGEGDGLLTLLEDDYVLNDISVEDNICYIDLEAARPDDEAYAGEVLLTGQIALSLLNTFDEIQSVAFLNDSGDVFDTRKVFDQRDPTFLLYQIENAYTRQIVYDLVFKGAYTQRRVEADGAIVEMPTMEETDEIMARHIEDLTSLSRKELDAEVERWTKEVVSLAEDNPDVTISSWFVQKYVKQYIPDYSEGK